VLGAIVVGKVVGDAGEEAEIIECVVMKAVDCTYYQATPKPHQRESPTPTEQANAHPPACGCATALAAGVALLPAPIATALAVR